jgi:hypothetical protein
VYGNWVVCSFCACDAVIVIYVCLLCGDIKEVSQTLGSGFKNLGNSAIQILEGFDVAAEQALGTGARIVTGVAETAAETAETGARKAIRIANVSFFCKKKPC